MVRRTITNILNEYFISFVYRQIHIIKKWRNENLTRIESVEGKKYMGSYYAGIDMETGESKQKQKMYPTLRRSGRIHGTFNPNEE
jgi:prephenate dehydratase